MQNPPRTRQLSLTTLVLGFLFACMTLMAVLLYQSSSRAVRRFQEQALEHAVDVRAAGLAGNMMRSLYLDWTRLRTIADGIENSGDRAHLRTQLDLIVGDGSRVSWAGLAGPNGLVIEASGGLLVGQDVSSRPWFVGGIQSDFAGDIHEAKLLTNLIPGDAPLRFLDFATPVRDESGVVIGVLAVHINSSWPASFLDEAADTLEIDAMIINREGEVVFGAGFDPAAVPDVPSIRAASIGAPRVSLEEWPDGTTQLSAVVPELRYRDMPAFGWSLIARVDGAELAQSGRSAIHGLLLPFLLAFGVIGSAGIAFVQVFVRPVGRAAKNVDAISSGSAIYPVDEHSSREAALLSSAAARIHATLTLRDRRT